MLWQSDYAIGHPGIDAQHQELFRRIQVVIEAMEESKSQEVVVETMGFLKAYAIEHFMDEEELMEEVDYPGLAAHGATHQGFIQELLKLEDKILNNHWRDQDAGEKTLELLIKWFVQHILMDDQAFGIYFRQRAG